MSQSLPAATSPPPQASPGSQAKKRRGGRQPGAQNFSQEDRDELLNIVEAVRPIGGNMWHRVTDLYNSGYAKRTEKKLRDRDSLMAQWKKMISYPMPPADPYCPLHIVRAKRLFADINNSAAGVGSVGADDPEINLDVDGEGNVEDSKVASEVDSEDRAELTEDKDDDGGITIEEREPTRFSHTSTASISETSKSRAQTKSPTAATTATMQSQSQSCQLTPLAASPKNPPAPKIKAKPQPIQSLSRQEYTSNAEAKELAALMRNRLDPTIQAAREEAKSMQNMLQLQVMTMRQDLGRREDKIDRLEDRIRGLEKEVAQLERELTQVKGEKQMLEMKLFMYEMQQSGEKRRKID